MKSDARAGVVGRLAPTPSGHLHLGNICAFAAAWLSVRSQQGTLLLRIEDIDSTRARPAIADAQRRDLEWLGLTWDREVPSQSQRDYERWLTRLVPHTYFCRCSRKEFENKNDGIYPGTCRNRNLTSGAIRLQLPPDKIEFTDQRWGVRRQLPAAFGDPVLRRHDGLFTYNLAVVVDDIRDGVTEVVRGADLLDFTAVQLVLWQLFSAPPPTFLHSPLILGPDGKKLSKSHGALHIGAMRERGMSAKQIWSMVLPWLGLDECASLADAVSAFRAEAGVRGPVQMNASEIPGETQ